MMVYIPERGEFLMACEGTGDNLLQEDIDEGYVDYIYIETYIWDGNEFIEYDGGQQLLSELYQNKYKDDDETMIRDAMEFMYGNRNYSYIEIKEGE